MFIFLFDSAIMTKERTKTEKFATERNMKIKEIGIRYVPMKYHMENNESCPCSKTNN